jgi:chlorobactene glucosyltransferase
MRRIHSVTLLLLTLPWVLVLLYLVFFFRNPGEVPDSAHLAEGALPFVSVIVPARDEEANIEACVRSLCASAYPAFEVVVVDDESRDRTAEIVQGLPSGNASRIRLLKGDPPPGGWFGKPWACHQGARIASGEVLLFTDADTSHGPDLLRQAVGGLIVEGADLYTVIGRQIMGSFWERVVQPQFFMLLAARYPRAGNPKRPHQWRHAIANGQYLLFTRKAYQALGGHESVATEVVEDLRIAQLMVRGGLKMMLRESKELQTRMYRSLGGLVEGWSKNVSTAALQTTAPWLLPIILPLSFLSGAFLWILPPATLLWTSVSGSFGTWFLWSGLVTALSVLIWSSVSALMKSNPLTGFLYPLGSAVGLFIFSKSWLKGTSIRWKGRDYRMRQHQRTLVLDPPDDSGRES